MTQLVCGSFSDCTQVIHCQWLDLTYDLWLNSTYVQFCVSLHCIVCSPIWHLMLDLWPLYFTLELKHVLIFCICSSDISASLQLAFFPHQIGFRDVLLYRLYFRLPVFRHLLVKLSEKHYFMMLTMHCMIYLYQPVSVYWWNRFGFHWPPFTTVQHLHLHAISPADGVKTFYWLIGMFSPSMPWFRSVSIWFSVSILCTMNRALFSWSLP